MTMLTGLPICTMIVLKGVPETTVARWLDRTLVAALRKITRTHLIFLMLMSVILIAGTELLALAGPFDMALVVMWDVAAYIDIILAAATAIATVAMTRRRSGWRVVTRRFRSAIVRRTGRARRRRPSADRSCKPANDDHPGAFARAA